MDIGTILTQYYIPVIFVGCLCVGYIIKKASLVDDRYIPAIVGILGALSGIIVNGLAYESVVCGLASGLASTGAHQIFKQIIEGKD